VQEKSGPKLVDWNKELAESQDIQDKLKEIKNQVEEFAEKFEMPGHKDF